MKRYEGIIIIILCAILIVLLVDLSNITKIPFGRDYSYNIASIHFMDETGFGYNPHWYNTIKPFIQTNPLFYMIAAFINKIFNNYYASLYAGIIVSLLLTLTGFIFMVRAGWSKSRSIITFLIFVTNPLYVSWIFQIGRLKEMLAWSFLIMVFYFVWYYKDRPIDGKFNYVIIPLSLMILSQPSIFILSIFSFILLAHHKHNLKDKDEIKKIILVFISSLIATAWWSIDMIFLRLSGKFPSDKLISLSFDLSPASLLYTLLLPSFGFLYILFLKPKKEIKLNIILVLIFYYLTRIISIPVINYINPRSFALFILLIILYDIDHQRLINKYTTIAIILLCLFSLAIFKLPLPLEDQHNKVANDLLALKNNSKIAIISNGELDDLFLYAYSTVTYNQSTPFGWMTQEESYEILKVKDELFSEKCSLINKAIYENKIEYILANDKYCEIFSDCGYRIIQNKSNICLIDNMIDKNNRY